MIENILYIVTINYNNYLNLSIVEELLILKCHCQRKKGSPIVQFRVRYDRWIKELKTHFLQP